MPPLVRTFLRFGESNVIGEGTRMEQTVSQHSGAEKYDVEIFFVN